MGVDAVVDELVRAELIAQVKFTPTAEFAFRHPLIRTVAYESQLKADRATVHKRLATAIEQAGSADENAALIAEHLEAGGDLREAYSWRMRAGDWSINRDIAAAHVSWERALQLADVMPDDEPDRLAMRIAPRTLICANGYRIHAPIAGARFEELQELCTTAGDKSSLAIAMAGVIADLMTRGHTHESVELSSELTALLESIGEPTLIVGLAISPLSMGLITGDMAEMLRLSQMVIDLSDSDSAEQITWWVRHWHTPMDHGRSLGGRTARTAGATISIEPWRWAKLRSLVTNNRPHARVRNGFRTQRCCGRRRGDTGHRSGSGCGFEHSADDLALGFSLIAMGVALAGRRSLQPRPSED